MQRLKIFDMPFGKASRSTKYTETHLAVISKNYEKLERLLKAGANPNQQDRDDGGWTPLIWAVAMRRLDLIKLLLQYEADPNIQSKWGTTPISHCMKIALSDRELENSLGSDTNLSPHIVTRQVYLSCLAPRVLVVSLIINSVLLLQPSLDRI